MPDNLYRRDGIWWCRIRVAGREYRRSLRSRDRSEAKRRRDQWIEDLRHAAWHGEERQTWKAAVLRYVTEVLPESVKPATATRYRVSLRQLDPDLGPLYLDQIDRKVIGRLIGRRKKAGATNATIRRDLTAVSRVLAATVAWGWRDDNPARDFDRSVIRERRDAIEPVGDEDLAAVVAIAPPMLGRLLQLLVQTGMRLEEAGTLQRRHVDLRAGEATLYQTKTGRPRVIALKSPGGNAVGTIQGTPASLAGPWLFWHGEGDRYRNLSSRLAALIRKAGRRFRVHDLRHTFAIRWLQAGGDIYALSRQLGHRSVKTTEGYLAYVRDGGHESGHSGVRFEGRNGVRDAG